MKIPINTISTTLLAFGFLALCSIARAVSPPPDGGYAGGNTAEGQNALLDLTTGTYNTAIGLFTLESNASNNFNTGVGAGALLANIADSNTAVGAAALLSNTSGGSNVAIGASALFYNVVGAGNTATGASALFNNIGNTFNNNGNSSTGNGALTLFSNTYGSNNTAMGYDALFVNTIGSTNTAIGVQALFSNTTAFNNTALGYQAGFNATTGSNNVYIGAGINGVAGESDACRIAGIYGATITSGIQVLVNSDNRLGTMTSSKRFKQNIAPTAKASETLYKLRPVTFQYKKEIDPGGKWQFGLVAEDVDKVNPDLVVHDKEGKPYSVRYDQVNSMLLNEFLKEHSRVTEQSNINRQQEKTITELKAMLAEQEKELKTLKTGLERVSDRLDATKPANRLATNNE
jgi:uncharacterized coiled-coil protein SlyX